MSSKIEKLDVNNIIEVKRIKGCLQKTPELLTIFEMILRCCNHNINLEKKVERMEIEDDDWVDDLLSSDSDEDLDTPNL